MLGEVMVPLNLDRIASFVEGMKEMTAVKAERKVVERRPELFEEEKPCLLECCGLG